MADVNVQVVINAINNLSAPLKAMGRDLTALGDNADKIANGMNKLGTGMVALGAAPALAIGFATKAAIEFESSFAGVRKTVDLSQGEFDQLAQNFRNISKVTPLAVNDLNRIGEIAGSLGVSGVDNLTKFTKTIAQIGITSNLTEEEAAMAFGRIANIMQEPIDNVDRMGAVVIDLGNKLAATESDITNFSERIAGAGKIAGLSTRDIFGIGAAMASVGVEAEAGGTAVQKVLISIKQATVTGNKDLAVFAKTAGMSSKEFTKAWSADPGKAFSDFVMGLGKQGDQAINTLSTLGLEDQRLIRAFLSLSNAGDLIQSSLNTANTAWKQNSALTAEAEKRYATTASQLQIFRNNVNDIGITLGETLLPRLNELLDKLKPIIQGIANFAKEHPKLTVNLLAAAAAIGVVGGALIILSPIVSALGVAIPLLGGGFGLLRLGVLKAIPAIGAFLTAIGPVGWILIGITAAVALFALAWKNNWGDIQGKTKAVINYIKPALEGFIKTVKDFGQGMGIAFNNAVQGIKNFGDSAGNILSGALEGIKSAMTSVGNTITSVWNGILAFFASIPGTLATSWAGVIAFFNGLPNMIGQALKTAGDSIYNFFTQTLPYSVGFAVGVLYKTFTQDIPNAIQSGITGMTNAFNNFVTVQIPAAWNILVTFFTATLPALWTLLVTSFETMFTNIGTTVYNFTTVTVPQAFISMMTWLATEIPALGARLGQWFSQMGINIVNSVVAMKNSVVATWEATKNAAIETTVALVTNVVNWIASLPGAISDWLSKLPGIVSDWFTRAKEKAVQIAKDMFDGVAEWFGKIMRFFGDILDKAGQALSKAREAFGMGFNAGAGRATGGIVPGPIGSPQMVFAHGGEKIDPVIGMPGDSTNRGGGQQAVFNVQIGMYAGSEIEMRNVAEKLYKSLVVYAGTQNKTVKELLGG